jgi:small subunit ribosomal protein S17
MNNNIGIEVPQPKEECNDLRCPFHGEQKIRGSIFFGTVVAAKMKKTATIEKVWRHYIPKYERYEERKSRLRVHNPLCIDAKEGDRVMVAETKPISKAKKFIIIQKFESKK